MAVVGNIGAIPVFDSAESIPEGLLRHHGLKIAVHRGGQAFEFFEVRSPLEQRGMGFLPAAAAAGAAGGPVGILVGIGVSLIPVVGKLLGGLFHHGPSQQDRQAANTFEQQAAQTTQLFNQIQSQAVITEDDYNRAYQAYQILARMAQAGVQYIAQKWATPQYDAAYQQRLQQIRQAAQGAGGAQAASAGSAASGSSSFSSWLPVVVIAFVGLMALRD